MRYARNRRSLDDLSRGGRPCAGCGVVDSGVGVNGLPRLTVCVDFLGDRVALIVRGDLDFSTGSNLEAILEAVAGEGHLRVVLDLAECDFIDAAGLGVVAATAKHLDLRGGELTIRSPSGVVRRLLDLVGPAAISFLRQSEAASRHLGRTASLQPEGVTLHRPPRDVAPLYRDGAM